MLDIRNCFTHDGSGGLAQALTTDAISTNVLDLGSASKTTIQMGVGKKASILKILVTVVPGALDSGAVFTLETASNAALSAGVIVLLTTTTLAVADLAAGVFIFNQAIPAGIYNRYLGIRFNAVSEAATGMKIIAWLDEEAESGTTPVDND